MMKRLRQLMPAVALALALGAAGCGGSDSDGGSGGGSGEEGKAAAAIKAKILADTGIHPGLSFGGVVVAVSDEASRYLSGKGVQAENVKVTDVVLTDADKTADGDISFDAKGQTFTCTGQAMATKEDGSWTLGLLTITSCR
jgi:hypothetical protein